MGPTRAWLDSGRTEAEWEWWRLGPFDGGIPGLVRRVRRILDVSQRGLAALIDVSQSVVARWETGRTSPRARVLQQLLEMAGLHQTVHDDRTGEEVEPMRADGARQHGGNRFPAHVDLTVTGWWVPRGLDTSVFAHDHARRSHRRRDPAIHYSTSRRVRALQRLLRGTPVDHPALHQLVAEADHLDERREHRAARGNGGRADSPRVVHIRRTQSGARPSEEVRAPSSE